MSICSIGGVFPSSDVWAIAQAYRLLGREGPDLYDYFTRYGVREPVNQHWYLEFFLAFLPNVKELSVSGAWQWNDHNYWFMNTAAQLNRVQINGPLRIENIHPLLNMPSLRSLDLEEVIVMRQETGVSFEWHQPVRRINLKEASSGLEELRLGSSYISTSSLVTVINTTRALRSFTYEHSRNELSLRRIRFDFPGLAAALDRHKSSLQSIKSRTSRTLIHISGSSYRIQSEIQVHHAKYSTRASMLSLQLCLAFQYAQPTTSLAYTCHLSPYQPNTAPPLPCLSSQALETLQLALHESPVASFQTNRICTQYRSCSRARRTPSCPAVEPSPGHRLSGATQVSTFITTNLIPTKRRPNLQRLPPLHQFPPLLFEKVIRTFIPTPKEQEILLSLFHAKLLSPHLSLVYETAHRRNTCPRANHNYRPLNIL
jgi:hypothetical protein